MNIAVCVSHVPETTIKVKIGSDGKSIDPFGITYSINPYDEYAVEEALKTKAKFGGEVTVISIGTEANKETIRKTLAMGADKGILLKDDSSKDSFAIAKALTEELKTQNYEIVFFGKQSVDYNNAITGQLTAEFLGFNCVSFVIRLKIENNKIIAEREIEGGIEVVETELPAIITTQKGLNEPRYASLKGIISAKKKLIHEKPALQTENLTEIVKMYKLPEKQPGRILSTDISAVIELVKLLHEEANVI